MKKALILILTLCATLALAAPSLYDIKALPDATTPVIDADLSEWNDSYLIDSLQSDNNTFCRDDSIASFDRNRLQYYVYACHSLDNVYYAVKTVADNLIRVTSTYGGDCIKVNPGGQAAAFYIWASNTIQRNPSNPYQVGVNMDGKANPTGNSPYPTYEFYISKAVLDQFGLGSWQISVGMEDNDRYYMGVGVEYLGTKTGACWNGNPWDNQVYYPSWNAVTTTGDPLTAVETRISAQFSTERLSASPNPFMPSTVLSYNVNNSGSLKIYDVSGKVVKSFSTKAGAGKVQWDATDMNGKSLSSGIYIARIVSGKNVLDQRLFLTR